MRTEMIYSSQENHSGYGAGSGDTEHYEYACPCGNGKIIEMHDNIPGFRDHVVLFDCPVCKLVYDLDTSKGDRYWELVVKPQ